MARPTARWRCTSRFRQRARASVRYGAACCAEASSGESLRQADHASLFAPHWILAERGELHPAHFARIRSRARVAARHACRVIDEYVMRERRRRMCKRIDHIEQPKDFDFQSRFLPHLAPQRVMQHFAGFDLAAGNAPFIVKRGLRAADQQHVLAAIENDRADAYDGRAKCGFCCGHGRPESATTDRYPRHLATKKWGRT